MKKKALNLQRYILIKKFSKNLWRALLRIFLFFLIIKIRYKKNLYIIISNDAKP